MDPAVLSDLILALFKSEPELRRFLNLAGLEEVEQRLRVTKGGSLRRTAREAADVLVAMGLVDEPLFAELARRDPGRADDIWNVARELGVFEGETPARSTAVRSEAAAEEPVVPDEYAKFAAKLKSALAEDIPADPAEEAMNPQRWPWTAAASVLGAFRAHKLRPMGPSEDGSSALTAFAGVVFTTADDRWALEDHVRTPALARLEREGSLIDALEANALIDDVHRDFVRDLVTAGDLPPLAHLPSEQLNALDAVLRWLDPLQIDLSDARAAVYAAVERRSLIDPLRELAGRHFRGRAKELERLGRHIRGHDAEPTTIAVSGPGGAGKSSLLGKVLVELEDEIVHSPISFAYVDFDKARHNPNDQRGLVEQIVRQVRLLYSVNSERSRGFAAVEANFAQTDADLAAEVLDLGPDAGGLDLDGLIRQFASRLEEIPRAYAWPLVLILDTFEEVQIQGPGAVDDVRDLLRRLQAAMPGMRVVLSGRGDLSAFVQSPEDEIVLRDLDAESADAVLKSLGVDDPSIRTLVYERFGGNPLILHLAAEALRRMETPDRAFKGVLDQTDAVATIGVEQIQGMLYERILGHIADPEVVKVAHPGLAVRRITIDVIRDVLAEPCGLDPERAPVIFERLRREISMFQIEDDGALRHRQDVRRLMLRAMANEPVIARTAAEIHRRAVAFYERSERSKSAQAEEIYHRLMSGQDPRTIATTTWDQTMRELLVPALEDPLPERARTWVRRRLGWIEAEAERAAWDQEDWEAEAESRVRSWLASDKPDEALVVLGERSERLLGSRLYALEAAALIDVGRFNEAADVLDRGMRSCMEAGAVEPQLELAEQATRLGVSQHDADRIVTASRSALQLSEITGDRLRGIGDLTGSVAALRNIGASEQAQRIVDTISHRFSRLEPDVLRQNPELVRAVMQTAGATDTNVLAQAAETLGHVTSERDAVFRDDAFALTRLLDATRPEGRAAMNELAVEVGLPENDWTPRELATYSMRRGRTGKAVAVGLDWAREESTARSTVVNELALPVDLGDKPWNSGI